MPKLLAALVILATAILPLSAEAQQPTDPPSLRGAPMSENKGGARAMAIGAGLAIGAIIGSSLTSIRATTTLGAIAGGLIGNWWYNESLGAPALKPGKPTP